MTSGTGRGCKSQAKTPAEKDQHDNPVRRAARARDVHGLHSVSNSIIYTQRKPYMVSILVDLGRLDYRRTSSTHQSRPNRHSVKS